MILDTILLQNFRSYDLASFSFDKNRTLIVGPNTAGKSNLIEAISFLSLGTSARVEKDIQVISFSQEVARVKGKLIEDDIEDILEVILAKRLDVSSPAKKYLVNGVAKRRADFSRFLPSVLFSPEDVDIVIDGPSLRRGFLDEVLSQSDREYALSLSTYQKTLRQRNALLERAQEIGKRVLIKQFEYWDNLLILNGQFINEKRQDFILFVNKAKHEIFPLQLVYDESVISEPRLVQYEQVEIASGNTLVGPHRDDFRIDMFQESDKGMQDVRAFGSRGQQRLAIFQLRLLQIQYLQKYLGKAPLLLLDDIFSELDEGNINKILTLIGEQQTILTTTHKEFVPAQILKDASVIELKK